MATNELMRQLSQRLDPARQEFGRREREWAFKLIHIQIPDDLSLFWQLPSHFVGNLRKFLSASSEDRLGFFLACHSHRYKHQIAELGVRIPDWKAAEALSKRCYSPSEADVRKFGLIPFPYSSPRLNHRKLLTAVRQHVEPVFGSELNRDPNDPSEWVYRVEFGAWQIFTILDASGSPFQFRLEHDIRLGMGDLGLRRQLSLHGVLGIGAGWDIAVPGEEQSVGILASEYCRFFIAALPRLLDGLEPGISREEIRRAEEEWKQGLREVQ